MKLVMKIKAIVIELAGIVIALLSCGIVSMFALAIIKVLYLFLTAPR